MNLSDKSVGAKLKDISEKKKIGLMTHTVIGYPSLEESEKIVLSMDEAGADFIELQIPFSDPVADGPTILTANHGALNTGITVADCFSFMERMSSKTKASLIFITYANIPYKYGVEAFCRDSKNAGACAVIIPDLPVDDDEGLYNFAPKYGISAIPVISEVTKGERLSLIDKVSSDLIYCTARMGVTGSTSSFNDAIVPYLESVKKVTSHALAVGFGISKREHVESLVGVADVAIVGSHLLNLYKEAGVKALEEFVSSICITQ